VAQCDFCSTELKKKWDWGFTSKDAVICRPCDKQGLGEDTDEETSSSTGSGMSDHFIIFLYKLPALIFKYFCL